VVNAEQRKTERHRIIRYADPFVIVPASYGSVHPPCWSSWMLHSSPSPTKESDKHGVRVRGTEHLRVLLESNLCSDGQSCRRVRSLVILESTGYEPTWQEWTGQKLMRVLSSLARSDLGQVRRPTSTSTLSSPPTAPQSRLRPIPPHALQHLYKVLSSHTECSSLDRRAGDFFFLLHAQCEIVITLSP